MQRIHHIRPASRHLPMAAAAAILLALAVANPFAGAAAKRGSCSTGQVCFFSDADFQGQEVRVARKGISNKLAEKMNNQASSVVSFRDGATVVYDKRNGKGFRICLNPGTKTTDLSLADFDDRATSTRNTSKSHCRF